LCPSRAFALREWWAFTLKINNFASEVLNPKSGTKRSAADGDKPFLSDKKSDSQEEGVMRIGLAAASVLFRYIVNVKGFVYVHGLFIKEL
jgi:hypothetical protein